MMKEGLGTTIRVRLKLNSTLAKQFHPPWAKYYKLVYAPNSTVDFFVQHMAGGAYTPSFAAEGTSSVIYVSLNYLQESVISYTSAFGARGLEGELNIYKYKEGDRLELSLIHKGRIGFTLTPLNLTSSTLKTLVRLKTLFGQTPRTKELLIGYRVNSWCLETTLLQLDFLLKT